MERRRKVGLIVLIIVIGIGIFGYTQYLALSEIKINITQSELIHDSDIGADYNVEIEFENTSLLILTAGETDFFISANDKTIGKGQLEPFTLYPLDTTVVNGTFHTDNNTDRESVSTKITGLTKYDLIITSLDIPFVYYPTEEQAKEFMPQN